MLSDKKSSESKNDANILFCGYPGGPAGPRAPGSPFGPIGPVAPCGPCGPVTPCGPVSPRSPGHPGGPGSPLGPIGPGSQKYGVGLFASVALDSSGNICEFCNVSASASDTFVSENIDPASAMLVFWEVSGMTVFFETPKFLEGGALFGLQFLLGYLFVLNEFCGLNIRFEL